jgi:alanyl-tRNA synthetase
MLPSNSGGGYNLRMVLRRVFGFEERYRYSLDYEKIIKGHAKYLEYIFPHLKTGLDTTLDVIAEEQTRYKATKQKARSMVINIVKKAKEPATGTCNKERVALGSIGTEELITLYKSHGIPPEAVLEYGSENNVEVKIPGNFYDLVREGEGEEAAPSKAPSVKVLFSDLASIPKTEPLYYSTDEKFKAKVLGIVHKKYVALDKSAFYPEGGGQVSDTGSINGVKVKQVLRQAGVSLHEVADASKFKKGDKVESSIDLKRRKTIARHHTAAHLLNAACREVLGSHIWQGGSHKDDVKAHLDVTHYRKISNQELAKIENKVNDYIMSSLPITSEILPRNDAESKYGFTLYQGGAVPGKEIRVVNIGDIDVEACGGTHQMHSHTGELGFFKIVKREGVQDGIERIIYKCGFPALEYIREKEALLHNASNALSVQETELVKTVERFFSEWKLQKKKIDSLSEQLVTEEIRETLCNYKGKPAMKIVDLDTNSLRKLGLKVAESDGAACFMNKSGNVVCAAGEKSGQSAKAMLEKVIKELSGSGGGSERIAQGKVAKVSIVRF